MKNEQIIECLLCGESSELRHKKYPGYQEPDTFEIYHCPHCNTAFSLPRLETAEIYENIYKNGNKVPGYNRYWKYAQIVKNIANPLDYLSETEETYWGVKEALSLSVKDKKTTKILELGSGLGYLTYSLIKANYNTVGLDISQTAVKHANETFGDHYICADLFQYAKLHSESFDIVILTEVIEHIDKPLDFIESIIKLLKPSGRAIITTPNKSLFPSDIIWATELPPVHCWWFSEESMKYIAKRIDVNISFINFSNYYKRNYHVIDLKAIKTNPSCHPILNKNGELIIKTVREQNTPKSNFRILVSKIPYIKKTYRKLKNLINPNIIICKNRGIVLCSIFQKKI